jgi:hypothetical protein
VYVGEPNGNGKRPIQGCCQNCGYANAWTLFNFEPSPRNWLGIKALCMNVLFAIHPYKAGGMWVFDDPEVGLRQEPFVSGADANIDRMVQGISNAEFGFRLVFSAQPFPGYQVDFAWRREEFGVNWYYCSALEMEGWLCPALFNTLTQRQRRFTRSSVRRRSDNEAGAIGQN